MALGSRWNLQPVTVKGNRVVTGHDAGVFETEELLAAVIGWPGQIRLAGLGRGDPEAGIELGQKALQHPVGCCGIRSLCFSQRLDQAVLESLPQPLDAAFGLRAVGGDQLNP
jgi:hypothetical protein